MTGDRGSTEEVLHLSPDVLCLSNAGGFVLGVTPLIYAVLQDLRVFEGGPVLLNFVYPDDGTRFIGAMCGLVVVGAGCRVGRNRGSGRDT